MSNVARAVVGTAYGLLVDDGQLAISALAALALTWLAAIALRDVAREVLGWLLLAMVLALVIANVYRAGIGARRKAS
jgi:hypothetical protein